MILRKFSSCAPVTCSRFVLLQSSLASVLSLVKPGESDRLKRVNALSEFTALVRSMDNMKDIPAMQACKEIESYAYAVNDAAILSNRELGMPGDHLDFFGTVVKPFGSFTSNLYTKWGDLDLCLNLSQNCSTERISKLYLLLDIMKALERTGVGENFKLLPMARVPLLIYESRSQKINCDVTIDNEIAVVKTNLICQISEMDRRFRDLILLIKEWAKAYDINDAKQRTLNSLSIYLLVMFHFQTCEPPILPPLKDIYPGNVVSDITGKGYTEREIEDVFAANIAQFNSTNDSSLDQLFVSFFKKFAEIGSMSSQYVICTYTGQWESILSHPGWLETSPFDRLIIEDPFRRPENAACSVGAKEMVRISNAFMETHNKLSSSDVLSDRDALLTTIVRSDIFSQLGLRMQQCNTTSMISVAKPTSCNQGHSSVSMSCSKQCWSCRETHRFFMLLRQGHQQGIYL